MDFREVVNSRRTTRQFSSKPVEVEKIRRVLEDGIKAPSFDHMRKWQFVVITEDDAKNKALETIKTLPCEITEAKNPMQETIKIAFPKQRTMFEEAGCIILPLYKRDSRIINEEAVDRRFMDFAEIWCVIENIFLSAVNEGLACAMRIPTDKQPDEILRALDVPEGYLLTCIIGVGYAAENAEYPTQVYQSLEECVHWNKW